MKCASISLAAICCLQIAACSGGGSASESSSPTAPDPPPAAPPPATTGSIQVAVESLGEQLDADGFMVVLDGQAVASLTPSDQVTIGDVEVGFHLVGLQGVAPNCSVKHRMPSTGVDTDPNPTGVGVVAGQAESLDFIVVCLPPGLGTLLVETPGGRLMTMTATGGDPQSVGRVLGSQFHTNASAQQIVYTNFSDSDLYITDLSGNNSVNLTRTAGSVETNAALSPDGTEVAFNRLCCAPNFQDGDLMVVNTDGTDLRMLLAGASGPAWSADGSLIAASGDAEVILIMNSDGSDVREVPGIMGGGVQWSPDGTELAFHHRGQVHVARVDGTGLRTLTIAMSARGRVAWSPDGRWIAWPGSDIRGGGGAAPFDIFVARADGGLPPFRVTTGERLVWLP